MTDSITIRDVEAGDAPALDTLYPDAFPDEDLLPLVHALAGDPSVVASLVAAIGPEVVGHALFTRCGIEGSPTAAALLGPVAVATARQRQGVGSALVRTGLERMATAGVEQVFVLGDPAYYGRFGFTPDTRVAPPYPLPAEWARAWQSQPVGSASAAVAGTLVVFGPWRDPVLWSAP